MLYVGDTVTVLVNGWVVGIPVSVRETVTERVIETLIDIVNGCVVGRGVAVIEIVSERVAQPLTERVKGCVVGMLVTETVLHGDAEYVTEGVTERV